MTTQENTALALLRAGRSFSEAAESSGLAVADVMLAWEFEAGASISAGSLHPPKPQFILKPLGR